MRIISQNITNYGLPYPDDVIFRINLAWCDSLDDLKGILNRHKNAPIFLDLPIKRLKPPNNKYTMTDLIPIIRNNKNICYFAVSNVESSSDLTQYIKLLPNYITIVPKIESIASVSNLEEITNVLPNKQKVIMLDHDDLYSNLIKNNEPESKFKEYIQSITKFCEKNKIILLRTIGVIFSDEEKRISQYIK